LSGPRLSAIDQNRAFFKQNGSRKDTPVGPALDLLPAYLIVPALGVAFAVKKRQSGIDHLWC
jgi:hypothetical protein